MKIGIANDHRGLHMKQVLTKYLTNKGYDVINYGTNSEESTDYPIYAFKLCKQIGKEIDFGILICGTGIGISIAANKVKGIRCAKISNVEEAKLCREHNNANVIAFGEKTDVSLAKEMVKTFLETDFSNGERHIQRIKEIEDFENAS